jgi:hypothetical protein
MSWRTAMGMKLRGTLAWWPRHRVFLFGAQSPQWKLSGSASSDSECCRPIRDEHVGERVGTAGINLPVTVRSGHSRADRPAASLAGVVVTRGLKRRQQVHGVYGLNPEMCLSWRPSWNPLQRRQYGRSRYARGRLLRRGLSVGHVHTVGLGTQENRRDRWLVTSGRIREGKTVAWCRMPCRKSDWPIVSMKSPKATR